MDIIEAACALIDSLDGTDRVALDEANKYGPTHISVDAAALRALIEAIESER